MTERSAKRVLLTGAAGFIGSQTAHRLLDRGCTVSGVDSLTPYYPVDLKRARLQKLAGHPGFSFHELDVASHAALRDLATTFHPDVVIHLAAQAGVRYSLDNPFAYAHANLTGHLSVLEVVRHLDPRPALVYASSSSVYGANTRVPFSEDDRVDTPVSLYAATKRSGELISESYSRLYGMRQIGLRFFTVYGPWGRPDMAYWAFTKNILEGKPIRVFNNGNLERDFTYIDDIVSGVVSVALDPAPSGQPLHRIYNIGNNKPARLMDFIHVLEKSLGRQAQLQMEPMQPGDVHATYANIDALSRDYGFKPSTSLEEGIPKFVEWYRAYTAG